MQQQHVSAPTSPGRTWWWAAAQRWALAEWREWRPSPWWPGETWCTHTHFTCSTAVSLVSFSLSSGRRGASFTGGKKQTLSLQQIWEHSPSARTRPLTCLAAILEDPTTLPLSSSTSMPSDSSVCLIKPTLQMFAVASGRKQQLWHHWLYSLFLLCVETVIV